MNYLLNEKCGWIVPDNTVIENNAQIPEYSIIGNGCRLGERCSLGSDCSLGDWCQWLGVKVIKWLTISNVDGSGRQLKIIRHAGGVKIEAGCFCGDSDDFIAKAKSEGKHVYVDVVGAVIKALMEIKL